MENKNIRYADKREYTSEQIHALFKSVDWLSADYPQRLFKALNSCETVFTAWDEGRLIGLINAIDDGELTAYVHYLLVDPEYQKLGVGKKLLDMVKEKYSNYLYLLLVAENQGLIEYYEKNGFEKEKDTSVMVLLKK